MSVGWTRLLATSTTGNFVDGLSMAASGPTGDVALGTETGCGDAEGFWSSDGRRWQVISHPPVVGLATFDCSETSAIAATGTGFVAVGNTPRSGGTSAGTTTGLVWTSRSGDAWRVANTASTFRSQLLSSVASDGHLVVVVGSRDMPTGGVPDGELWYSSDGSRWSHLVLAAHAEINAVAYGPRGWVAVGAQLSAPGQEVGSLVWRSDNGRNWTPVNGVPGLRLFQLAAGPVGFIARGYDDNNEMFVTSVDGRRWSQRPPLSAVAMTGPSVSDVGILGSHFLAFGQVDDGFPNAHPGLWVLDQDSWVRVALPPSPFFEAPSGNSSDGALQPTLSAGIVARDGSLLVVGGGRPASLIAKPSYGPRLWRWKPTSRPTESAAATRAPPSYPAAPLPLRPGARVQPADLSAMSFVDSRHGFALTLTSSSLTATADGGATWRSIGAAPPGVWALDFTSVDDGWAYGPDRFVTHDGGRTWIATHPEGDVDALDVIGSSVWSLVGCTAMVKPCVDHLERSDDGGRTWRSTKIAGLPAGAARLDRVDASRAFVWSAFMAFPPAPALVVTSDGGETWHTRQQPCGPTLADLSAVNGYDLWLSCSWSQMAATPKQVFRSYDGGDTWTLVSSVDFAHDVGRLPIGGYGADLLAVSDRVAILTSTRGDLAVSTDGGVNWSIPIGFGEFFGNTARLQGTTTIWVDSAHSDSANGVWRATDAIHFHQIAVGTHN
jgi:hypothetical protein